MRTRLLLLVLSAGLIVTAQGARTAAQAPKPPQKGPQKGAEKPGQVPVTSSVFYRSKGSADWNLFGIYKDEAAGKAVFRHLAGNGYEVELRISNVAVPKTPPHAPSTMLPASEVVSFQKLKDAFDAMSAQGDIAFKFPVDGCYARAHIMCQRLQQRGLKPYKIWSFANGEPLYAKTENHPAKFVTWGYHVAPVLRVQLDAKTQRWYVLDPSIFKSAVTVKEWEDAQMKAKDSQRPYVYVSRLGSPPKLLSGKNAPGTGYWPGNDPKEGPDAHAVAMMKKYKPWEGKAPPKGIVGPLEPAGPARWLAARDPQPALHPRRRVGAMS